MEEPIREVLRDNLEAKLVALTERYPVTVVLGARQVGKTTLIKKMATEELNYFDLDQSLVAERLTTNPELTLGGLTGIVVIDEIQELPSLFQVLKYLADRKPLAARFIVAGSASPEIIKGASESLAGRAGFLRMGGHDLDEVQERDYLRLWKQGSYPRMFAEKDLRSSYERLENYLSALCGRDLIIWGGSKMTSGQIRNLLALIADASGQRWNHSNAGKILGVTYKTIQSHIELFRNAFLIRELKAFEKNLSKQVRKMPKLLLRDSGLMHALSLTSTDEQFDRSPSIKGPSWETFAADQIIRLTGANEEECYYWEVPGSMELDLVIKLPTGIYGFEFKVSPQASPTKAMARALEELSLDAVFMVHTGKESYSFGGGKMEAIGMNDIPRMCHKISNQ